MSHAIDFELPYPGALNLAAERLGTQVLSCSDDFFASKDNLIKSGRGIFIADKYTDNGKWMDGWESRRRRDGGYDWCTVRLGAPGRIDFIDADTNHFRGNAPASVSLDACYCLGEPDAGTQWTEILPKTSVNAHSQNLIKVDSADNWTHVRLNIYPDGGVARLRVYGSPQVDWSRTLPGELVDLAAIANGGRALLCSDMFFSDMQNLLMPGRGVNMGDGWETKRRRGPGYDWLIMRLAAPGALQKIIVDTCHFKGNYPDRFSLEGAVAADPNCTDADSLKALEWRTVIAETKLHAHREHLFMDEIQDKATAFTHLRLNIYPDGGVSRLRVLGYPK
ncbi:Allantoicase [Hahella chejuensis KCTC 2396]|uniref:Probable allantoicase n=1 Tax=Hahella chejuensis (strain KCTC 2396) TaxID=349521 RepID=Q2SMZ9_HAHCH|nr:allantoicase [Hahella chejuensis]ABC27975.1 Allantoicase [Hahella chejuensis KCTC 2396]